MFHTQKQFDKFFVSKFSFHESYKYVNHLVVLFNCLNLISLERFLFHLTVPSFSSLPPKILLRFYFRTMCRPSCGGPINDQKICCSN